MQRLKRDPGNAWIKYILSFSLGAGVLIDHLFFKPPSNSTLPLNFEYGKNIGYNAIPNQQDGVIKPDIKGTGGGVTLVTNTSGIPCSGAFYNNYTGIEIIGLPPEKKHKPLKKRSHIRK